jgi:hypothetical protein
LVYADVVRGRGCGGDMAAVASIMVGLSSDDDILCFTDDDIRFTSFPVQGVKKWVESYLSLSVCAYAYNEDNHFLKQDLKGLEGITVLRNKGPVFAIRQKDYVASGGYDAYFHQANDVDIQQRFNIFGISHVTKTWKYKAGTFQEGGMSAFYNVQESRRKYQENTARALYQMKQKYPWLWKSSVSFKKTGTSAVYRTDKLILDLWRLEYQQGKITLGAGGLYRPGNPNPLRWQLEEADKVNLGRLEEIWNGNVV